jgi:PQQ-dependent dehydrogenase (methanol/ethanol family)
MRMLNPLVAAAITVAFAVTAAYYIKGSTFALADSAESRLVAADREPQNWLTHGRTYSEQRFSPLTRINATNSKNLGLAWYHDLGTGRGQEATPLEVDGVIYVSTAWSIVKAFDARDGATLWTFDPQVPRARLAQACCDAVNRGLAFANGAVFIATLDGRLIAIDTKSGKPIWSVITFDRSQPYSSTGAPRVVKGLVIIGNAGADLGVRGYVSAYDAATGKMVWRFYTVQGDPAKPVENPILAKAMKTWKGDLWWKRGGGGTVWDAIAYDPILDLLYVGTGNGGPWNQQERSPDGGDNLFLASIVALRPETGEYVWHYQVNPGDDWDYTATQPFILATLEIGGRQRNVIMQAPKNGFFYVLDRQTGELLSAKNFVPTNWADRIDMTTGRPVENPAARYDRTGKPFLGWPSTRGAHSWMPMSYSPVTGLVYIPTQETSQVFDVVRGYRHSDVGWNTATLLTGGDYSLAPPHKAYLLAWDPVTQKERWRIPYNRSAGGVLTTAGNLLVQGEADGHFNVYRADTGERLWRTDAQSMPMAGPITYEVGREQYIAVMAGCGGDFSDVCGLVNQDGRIPILDRLLVYKLRGTAELPPKPSPSLPPIEAPTAAVPPDKVAQGHEFYDSYCLVCHGNRAVSTGLNPDLRYSYYLSQDRLFSDVVLGGTLKEKGMISFAAVLSPLEASAIRSYLVSRAQVVRKQ